jgi:23S rRNA (pseudouridine1915-N3)-methyltransferase
MNITLLCIGKLKEQYWIQAMEEYSKRLGRFCRLTIQELPEERLSDHAGSAEEQAVIEAESSRIQKKMTRSASSYVIALDIQGKSFSSTDVAEKLADLGLKGKSDVTFIIGGSLGLSRELLDRADLRLSFSQMTFPHQMMRVILLEQIYRAFKINANEAYHK